MLKTKISPSIEDVKHLQIPFEEISSATNKFADENFIARGGFGWVYKGISEKYGPIAVKRLDIRQGQGDFEFKTEIAVLSKFKHENVVSLLGFCDENYEKILVYKYESNGSLDNYINSKDLTWIQLLQICLDVAYGLNYLHSEVEPHKRFIHRDIKSSNILLDENWKPKISDFGLSRVDPTNRKSTFIISHPCGTPGYIDPDYLLNGYLTQKSDVHSFGIVLWEVLCRRLAYVKYEDERMVLPILVQKRYTRHKLYKIIPSDLHKQINAASLETFSSIAYRCLRNGEARPTMRKVVEQLQKALDFQLGIEKPEVKLEVKKPEERRKTEEEKVARVIKKEEKSKDPRPHPPSQEVALRVLMHCKQCAREVRQQLKDLEGVQEILTDFCLEDKNKQEEVHYMGYTYDSKQKEKIDEPLPDITQSVLGYFGLEDKYKQEEVMVYTYDSKRKEKIDEPLPVITVVLKVHMHCEKCARKIRKSVLKMKGVQVYSVVSDLNKSELTVIGRFPIERLVSHLYRETGKKVVILNLKKGHEEQVDTYEELKYKKADIDQENEAPDH